LQNNLPGSFAKQPAKLKQQGVGMAGHELLLDVPRAHLYCVGCQDFIYDPSFDLVVAVRFHFFLGILGTCPV
jgi:hypothetical protein